jgi:phosphatidylethanolamine/phosphatidyl-N-methylethanolamine N-methyltransferase
MNRDEIVSNFYDNYYSNLFSSGKSLASWSKRQTHTALEHGLSNPFFERVLEIGAGSGEHFQHVQHSFNEYLLNDLTPPKHSTVLGDPRIRIIVGDVNQIDIPNGSIDRVIMTCVLHHLPDPYQTLLKIADWMKPGSLFTLFLPSDPGFLVRLNRNLVVIPAARRLGYDRYRTYAALGHRNHYWGFVSLIEDVFQEFRIKRTYHPFYIKSGNLSLFSVWRIKKRFV